MCMSACPNLPLCFSSIVCVNVCTYFYHYECSCLCLYAIRCLVFILNFVFGFMSEILSKYLHRCVNLYDSLSNLVHICL
jgi:hypothetical protein